MNTRTLSSLQRQTISFVLGSVALIFSVALIYSGVAITENDPTFANALIIVLGLAGYIISTTIVWKIVQD